MTPTGEDGDPDTPTFTWETAQDDEIRGGRQVQFPPTVMLGLTGPPMVAADDLVALVGPSMAAKVSKALPELTAPQSMKGNLRLEELGSLIVELHELYRRAASRMTAMGISLEE